MKVLFLDIDGVVNCKTTTQRHRGLIGIDPMMAFLVGKIILNTEANIVLSSSWRHSERGIYEVERQVHKIFDKTPIRSTGLRGNEIAAWLESHPEVTRYAILDDDSDMLDSQKENFFQTSWEGGITPEIAKKVTEHLNK